VPPNLAAIESNSFRFSVYVSNHAPSRRIVPCSVPSEELSSVQPEPESNKNFEDSVLLEQFISQVQRGGVLSYRDAPASRCVSPISLFGFLRVVKNGYCRRTVPEQPCVSLVGPGKPDSLSQNERDRCRSFPLTAHRQHFRKLGFGSNRVRGRNSFCLRRCAGIVP
jgi:hypothetical protein